MLVEQPVRLCAGARGRSAWDALRTGLTSRILPNMPVGIVIVKAPVLYHQRLARCLKDKATFKSPLRSSVHRSSNDIFVEGQRKAVDIVRSRKIRWQRRARRLRVVIAAGIGSVSENQVAGFYKVCYFVSPKFD
jgi:hypothetical protein